MSILITWLGHACFKIESKGYAIVLDPYADNYVPGLSKLRVTANKVLCSHQHDDHAYVDAVKIVNPDAPCPFSIKTVPCPHDDEGGKRRGMNLIHILEADGLRVAHFGDIGCMLNDEQIAEIGRLDAAILPVGGYYTIDAQQAKELVDKLNPKVVIPMHYRSDIFGFSNIGTVWEFTKLCDDVVEYDGDMLVLDRNTTKHTAVLQYIS